MNEHKIVVDIYADWDETPPRYRVYVDDDLLTERDFIWDNQIYVRENILVNLGSGTHKLRIEQCNSSGSIRTENVKVNDIPSSMEFVI
jgi:hypothetical protein